MMMSINIKFLSDDALTTLKVNSDKAFENISLNPISNQWIYSFLPSNPFEEKKFKIKDFELETFNGNDFETWNYNNSIKLYENLKKLPRRILADERFWLWLYFEKFYEVSVQTIKLKSPTTFKNHWTFSQGNRRGLFFGVLSRNYFRVDLSVDESLKNKYELTKYIFDKNERFRTLSWRTFSNNKTIVLGVLKAQRDFELDHNIVLNNESYNLISKRISRYGSVNLLDAATEEEIYDLVYTTLKILTKESVT